MTLAFLLFWWYFGVWLAISGSQMSECRDHVSGLPLVCILCPLHFFCGGSLDEDDILSWIGMANVEQGSWLCWVHSGIVWFVVIVVQHSVKSAQVWGWGLHPQVFEDIH